MELFQAGLGDLANTTVGLVGFGNIARAVAQRLLPFGSRLQYTARHTMDPQSNSSSVFAMPRLRTCWRLHNR